MRNLLLATIAILSAAQAFAASGNDRSDKRVHLMQFGEKFDANMDNSLTRTELTAGFESIIEARVSRARQNQSEAVIFSPVPEDLVNYLLKDFDANGNQMIELDELAASQGILRKFKLGLNAPREVGRS